MSIAPSSVYIGHSLAFGKMLICDGMIFNEDFFNVPFVI